MLVTTFDVLLEHFDPDTQALAEAAMEQGRTVDVVKTHIHGSTRFALLIDGATVAVVLTR